MRRPAFAFMAEEPRLMTEFEARPAAAEEGSRRRVFELLWLELTIAGRAVWSDPDLTDRDKLEGLKWLNEIQHRAWGAHAEGNAMTPADVVTNRHHVQQAPLLQEHVRSACHRALRALRPETGGS